MEQAAHFSKNSGAWGLPGQGLGGEPLPGLGQAAPPEVIEEFGLDQGQTDPVIAVPADEEAPETGPRSGTGADSRARYVR